MENSPKILALDTTTQLGTFAIGKDTGQIKQWVFSRQFKHSHNLFILLEKVLKAEGLSVGDFDAYAVDVGPGSFTGIRIAFSTLLGFSIANDVSWIGVNSLDVLGYFYLGGDKSRFDYFCPLIDARRGDFYFAVYERQNGNYKCLLGPDLVSLEGLVDICRGKRIYFFGPGLKVCKKALEEELSLASFGKDDVYPEAKNLAKIAYERFGHNEVFEAGRIKPLYLGRSQVRGSRKSEDRSQKSEVR